MESLPRLPANGNRVSPGGVTELSQNCPSGSQWGCVRDFRTFHFTKERCETRGEELCQVTDLAGSRSKTETQLSHPRVTGAPPPCDGASPGRPGASGFPLAVHVA